MIGRSVEQVEHGTVLVDQAGKTMGEIVGSIKRVSDIVAEITSATVEQSSGIAQVGDALSQMDQVTQQNAALVEESAAEAESLKTQAQQLVQAVAVFKLSGDARVALQSVAPQDARPSEGGRRAADRSKTDAPTASQVSATLPGLAAVAVVAPLSSGAGVRGRNDDWASY